MIKNFLKKKIVITSIALLLLSIIYLIPNNEEAKLDLNSRQELTYIYDNHKQSIYLIDSKNYISKTTIALDNTADTISKVKEIIEALIIDGKKQDIIPNGFRPIIPAGTTILDIKLEENIITINFSDDLLTIKEELEEKMIESLIYSITTFDDIKGIKILINGKKLDKLKSNSKTLPNVLTREFGVNKQYDLSSFKDINPVTIYYVNSFNNKNYYTPVTKYINNPDDKIKIIINELSSSPIYESNLMSFLNTNTKLVEYEIENDTMNLHFNNFIFDTIESKFVLEEVIYTIALSVRDNYDVDKVNFYVNNEEISKKSLKDID